MKITKNSYAEFKTLYNDLAGFLTELKCDETEFRMVIMDYSCTNGTEQVSYFDSFKEQIIKEALKVKNFDETFSNVLKHIRADEEMALIEFSKNEINDAKRQCFFVIFDFKVKATALLQEFLKRYQLQILQYLSNREKLNDIMDLKEDLFHDAVKHYIDLDIILTLAGSQYEKRDSSGSLFYIKNRREAVFKVKFTKEIDLNLNNLRLIRKLLEMSDRKLSLIVFEKKIVGLGFKDAPYRKVLFNGHQNWMLYLSQKEVLHFVRGKFFFDRGSNNQIISKMPKGFILKKYEKNFSDIINILTHQKHGALLIITDKAKEEVLRLSGFSRGYSIDPVDFAVHENLALIKNLASVDGAVFIDRHLKCYGTGIILDGVAMSSGSSARGSRYNSACCYLDNKKDSLYAALVFSEDETRDLILSSFVKPVIGKDD
ncbi:MAG: diadenylate cyclase [Firmicutes bacterium]|nr:diadenylate cyclase [Bacillota bacterium]